MKNGPLCLTLICLCALTGCSWLPSNASARLDQTPLISGKSRFLVYRDNDMGYYKSVSARVDINGQRVNELWHGEAYAVNVEPGPVTVSASAWSAPGEYTISFEGQPNMTYTLEIGLRADAAEGMGKITGGDVDYSVDENEGAFALEIRDVDKED
jgi:hypothetical protein